MVSFLSVRLSATRVLNTVKHLPTFNIVPKCELPALEAFKSLHGPTFAANNKNRHCHGWMTMAILTLVVCGDDGV